MNSWIEISESALVANYRTLQAAAGPATAVLAVIKANAYGHGAERCGVILARAGAPWLGVTCASEGARVRQALGAAGLALDAQPEILIMCGSLPADTPLLSANRLTPTVWTPEQARTLPPGMRVHVEVDTGMSRQGVTPGEDLAELLCALDDRMLVLDGMFTHFGSAEELPSNRTEAQDQRFALALGQLTDIKLHLPWWIHAGNTSMLDSPGLSCAWLVRLAANWSARAMVRSGIGLYGYTLPLDSPAGLAARPRVHAALRPVITWKAHVLAVRDLAPGDSVGYNATFTAREPMRVALLPVGYADGLRRELSSTDDRPGGWVMLHGERAPILGRISMNLTVVDVTSISGVKMGDEAIVLGPGITADDHARLAGTIAYEILCGIHPCG